MESESGKLARAARRRARLNCTLPAPEDKSMTLITRRFHDHHPEQWTATLTLDKGERVIELGPYKTLGRAMLIGLHVYHEWTMPPRLRRKYRHLLEDQRDASPPPIETPQDDPRE